VARWMHLLARSLPFVFGAVAFLAPGAKAQTYKCLPDTAEQSEVLRDYVVDLVTGTDSGIVTNRRLYHLPAVAKSKVTVVTTSSVCSQAGAAYHRAVTAPGTPPVSRTLVVIKVGTTRYVVLDPNHRNGEFESNLVFDTHWTLLIGFTG